MVEGRGKSKKGCITRDRDGEISRSVMVMMMVQSNYNDCPCLLENNMVRYS